MTNPYPLMTGCYYEEKRVEKTSANAEFSYKKSGDMGRNVPSKKAV